MTRINEKLPTKLKQEKSYSNIVKQEFIDIYIVMNAPEMKNQIINIELS